MDLTNINQDRKRRKAGSLDASLMMYGKVPPQAKDLEEAVLGAILLVKGAFEIVAEILTPDCFYVEANKSIFNAMRSMSQKSMPIDLLTLCEELRVREEIDLVGGPYYVSKLTNNVVSSNNIETHSRIILQKFIQREIIRVGGEMIGSAYEDSVDVFDLLDFTESSVFGLSVNYIKKDFSTIDRGLVKVIDRIEHLRTLDSSVTGVTTGYHELNNITHGWQPTDLIILAARPSVGKTSFALNLARNAAMHPSNPVPVGFFSLEMSEGQLITRILSAESKIWLTRLSTGRLDDESMKTLYKGVQRLTNAPIVIDDTAGLNMFELRAKARRMKNKHKVGLIIIDYLQLMSGSGEKKNGNREQEISSISRELKKLAKDLEIPIIALSQLSREVEKRSVKQPQLSDLRESGAIEQDADVVMFLYRPSEEDIIKDPELKNMGHLKISKHRNGDSGIEIAFEVSNNIQIWDERSAITPYGYTPVAKANEDQARIHIHKNYEEPEELPF